MLSDFEQRRLRTIEQSLEADDPAFAARLRTGPAKRDRPRFGGCIAISGAVLVAFGILFSPPAAWLGGCLICVGLWLRLILPAIPRISPVTDRGNGSAGRDRDDGYGDGPFAGDAGR